MATLSKTNLMEIIMPQRYIFTANDNQKAEEHKIQIIAETPELAIEFLNQNLSAEHKQLHFTMHQEPLNEREILAIQAEEISELGRIIDSLPYRASLDDCCITNPNYAHRILENNIIRNNYRDFDGNEIYNTHHRTSFFYNRQQQEPNAVEEKAKQQLS